MRNLNFNLIESHLKQHILHICSIIEYVDTVWDDCTQQDKKKLEMMQWGGTDFNRNNKTCFCSKTWRKHGLEALENRRKNHKSVVLQNVSPLDVTLINLSCSSLS